MRPQHPDFLGALTASANIRGEPGTRFGGGSLRVVVPISILASLALTAACDPSVLSSGITEQDPEFPDLDGGDDWSYPDGGGADDDPDGGASAPDDAGPDSGDDEDTLACLDIGWSTYQVEGTCPDLPATGAIEQTACDLAIPGALGLVIGETGTIDGAMVSTTSCAGIAAASDPPAVELTCLVDSASCTVELAGGLDDGFD